MFYGASSAAETPVAALGYCSDYAVAAAISYEAFGCAEPAVAAADAVAELAAFEVVDAAYADAVKFAAAVATLGFSAGAYQSTEPPPAALAP